MAYKSIIVKLLKELEDDTVITNPKGQSRALLRKLIYRSALWASRLRGFFQRVGRARPGD